MGRPHQVAALIKQGYSPSQIARKLKLNISTVRAYLWRAVGEGSINISDIVFAIPRNVREKVEELRLGHTAPPNLILMSIFTPDVFERLQKEKLDPDDTEIYIHLRRAVYGDLYGLIREIEVHLHRAVRSALSAHYGKIGWWNNGVDKKIRDRCAAYARADSAGGQEDLLFHYTSLHDLLVILRSQWSIVSRDLPKETVSNSDKFLSDLERLVKLRNAVMHPVKGLVPTKEDYRFAQELYSALMGVRLGLL